MSDAKEPEVLGPASPFDQPPIYVSRGSPYQMWSGDIIARDGEFRGPSGPLTPPDHDPDGGGLTAGEVVPFVSTGRPIKFRRHCWLSKKIVEQILKTEEFMDREICGIREIE